MSSKTVADRVAEDNAYDRARIILQKEMVKRVDWLCCDNCINWNKTQELCEAIKPAARPPAHIIATGCDSHYERDIPF